MTATTFETFDLLDGSGMRGSARRSIRSDGDRGPLIVRQLNPRQVRHYEVNIASATPSEVRRYNDLWNLTATGTLPMLFNHPDDGNVAVVFEERILRWLQHSASSATLNIRLKEFLG